MKKVFFIILLLAVIITAGSLFFQTGNENKNFQQVCFEKNCFKVETAATRQARERGLMFRKTMEQDRGMLFIFDNADIHPFWMKNTLFPLDIIWLDENNKVVFIEKDCQPCLENGCPNFAPFVSAKYVLEINAGLAEKIKLPVGGKMETRQVFTF